MNKKIIWIFGAFLLVGNIIYLYPKYQAINSDPSLEKNPLITRLADDTENAIQSKVGSLIVPASFTEPVQKNQASFEALDKFLHSDNLFRVKIWNTDHTVIWSDAQELIGKSFPNNEEIDATLSSGNRVIEMKRNATGGSDKNELLTEAFYNNYFELYHPIKDEGGRVIGIVETYQIVNGPLMQIRYEFYGVAALSLGSSVLLLILVFFTARRMSRS